MKDYKEVDEKLFEKLKEFIVCKMVDVDTTHDAPHFCDGEIVCLKDCYKWKIILEEIHSEIERAEKEGYNEGFKLGFENAMGNVKSGIKQARIEGVKEYMNFLIEHHRVKVIGETLYVRVDDMKTLLAEMEEKSQ